MKNFFLLAYKYLIKHKAFFLINIFGLAIGLSTTILTSLYVSSELSYDRQWQNAERIVRLNMNLRPSSLDSVTDSFTSYLMMPALKQFFYNDIELSARGIYRGRAIKVGDQTYAGGMWLYEKEIIDIFKFNVLAGSLVTTMENPGNIALSESLATTYYGQDNPLGKTLSLDVGSMGLVDYVVTAVYRLPEGKSALNVPSVALFDESTITERADIFRTWSPAGWITTNYFLLKAGSDEFAMNRQINEFMNQHIPPSVDADDYTLSFQAITDIHFNPNRNEKGGDKTQVATFAVIAILVLLIGSTNYVVLTTAGSLDRKHEAGIRKVMGCSKYQLIAQFFGESLVFTIISLFFALLLVEWMLPFYSTFVGQELEIHYLKISTLLFLVALIIVVAALGALYPILILISTNPKHLIGNRSMSLSRTFTGGRSMLIGFQFSIAIIMLIATLVLYSQLSFYQNRDHGFNPENLIAIKSPDIPVNDRDRLKTLLLAEIKKIPDVESATFSLNLPNEPTSSLPAIALSSAYTEGQSINSMSLFVGYDFFEVYKIPLLAGRTHDPSRDQPGGRLADNRIIINRFGATALGFPTLDAAIGQLVQTGNDDIYGEIIGVVENSQYLSLRKETNVELYILYPPSFLKMTVRYKESAANTIIADIQDSWRKVLGEVPFESNFVIQNLQQEFSQELNDGRLLLTLSLLSIFISCLGLFGLVAFTVMRQIKEIGIRKVLGASIRVILVSLIWQFTKPVLLANVIAWPLAVWVMLRWLARFPFQIDYIVLFPLCTLAGFIALFIAWITVGATAAKAARQKPILSLRYE